MGSGGKAYMNHSDAYIYEEEARDLLIKLGFSFVFYISPTHITVTSSWTQDDQL